MTVLVQVVTVVTLLVKIMTVVAVLVTVVTVFLTAETVVAALVTVVTLVMPGRGCSNVLAIPLSHSLGLPRICCGLSLVSQDIRSSVLSHDLVWVSRDIP